MGRSGGATAPAFISVDSIRRGSGYNMGSLTPRSPEQEDNVHQTSVLKNLAIVLVALATAAGCSDTVTGPGTESPSAPSLSGGGPGGLSDAVGEVIATGLNNPRHLALGPDGSLYVAEAGLGAGSEATGVQEGLGFTGSVTVIERPASARPGQHRMLTGLVSAAMNEEGDLETVGADGIAFPGREEDDPMYLSFGAHGPSGLGLLVQYPLSGTATTVADVGSASFDWTGDHADLWEEFPDANPYGVLALPGHLYVVDAAANTLNEVMPDGEVRVLAYFPNYADIGGIRDAVPTCVAQGPDGALYIGTLALVERFQLGSGQALVYRVDPAETNPDDLDTILHVATVWTGGFDTISSCAFAPNGDFYATEMFGGDDYSGDVVRVPFRHPDEKDRFGGGQVVNPTGIAVGQGGIYVSSVGSSTEAGAGQVTRFSMR
jgi:hypothetical protein